MPSPGSGPIVQAPVGRTGDIQGHLDEALAQYQRSLQAYREAGDRHGCAIAYHNLGMVSADRGLWDEAGYYFHRSRTLAAREGDAFLQGLALVSEAEVDVARQRYESARQQAEEALGLFDALGAQGAKADPYRVLGMVFRETGRPALAESRFRSAPRAATTRASPINRRWRSSLESRSGGRPAFSTHCTEHSRRGPPQPRSLLPSPLVYRQEIT